MWKIYRHGSRRLGDALREDDFAAAQHEFFVLGTEPLAESAAWISKQREERLDDDPLSIPARGAKLFEKAKQWIRRHNPAKARAQR